MTSEPRALRLGVHEQAAVKQVNLSHYMLPDDIDQQLTQLKQQLNDGERVCSLFPNAL